MLQVKGIRKNFSGVRAVDDVSLEVKEGSITGLIGSNGAGKTTTFNVISGFLPSDGGDIIFQGKSIAGLKPYEVTHKGIVRTFQTPKGFPKMTVMENMLVFAKERDLSAWSALFRQKKIGMLENKNLEQAEEYLRFVSLEQRKNDRVQELSAGELKLLEFARTLMAEPVLLLLDEPAAGVDPRSLGSLISLIKDLRQKGMTFLIVDHNLKFIMQVCDYIYVMAGGKLICSGVPDEVANNELVIESYIGRKQAAC
jgi:ABC-type branched-subunit amino acid transport system ATPase component